MTFPAFDIDVPPDGYAWWYTDAISDDGAYGLTVIAFVGSVFSPYYSWARARGATDPGDYCAINVALYGPGGRWTMTERRRHAVERTSRSLAIGPSSLNWNGNVLTIDIDEWAVPIPRRARGQIRIQPAALPGKTFSLDDGGRHRWTPVAPRASVDVSLTHPDLRWSGEGYLDHNAGDAPLESDFTDWQWSRTDLGDETAILYDANRRDGSQQSLALRFDQDGNCNTFEAPPWAALPATGWRVHRSTRGERKPRVIEPRVIETWEDTPFYARSKIETTLLGKPARGIHESLSLERFSSRWVRCLLPFRMPRR